MTLLALLLLGGSGCTRDSRAPSLPPSDGSGAASSAVAAAIPTDGTPRAELSEVLLADQRAWRRAEYEFYRWTQRPQVLIFDTADYGVQSRLFKRLAFFVEKVGWVGTIPDPNAIADLHGFNAHDYRSRDLAAFFTAAVDTDSSLLAEEVELREILLSTKIIIPSGSRFEAGNGAVISISRSSTPQLRQRFIAHEALHGLFYTVSAFRSACLEIWSSVVEEEREFFRLYFSWPDWSYDTANEVLMANEFMAYHLQLRRGEVNPYFLDRGVSWLRERFPEQDGLLDRIAADLPGLFLHSYDLLDAALRDSCGLFGGGLVDQPD